MNDRIAKSRHSIKLMAVCSDSLWGCFVTILLYFQCKLQSGGHSSCDWLLQSGFCWIAIAKTITLHATNYNIYKCNNALQSATY